MCLYGVGEYVVQCVLSAFETVLLFFCLMCRVVLLLLDNIRTVEHPETDSFLRTPLIYFIISTP